MLCIVRHVAIDLEDGKDANLAGDSNELCEAIDMEADRVPLRT
jgi:hypothetical protein